MSVFLKMHSWVMFPIKIAMREHKQVDARFLLNHILNHIIIHIIIQLLLLAV
jgi:hypothetical protein